MTVLLASGNTELASADVVLAAGSLDTLTMIGVGTVLIEVKNSAGGYREFGQLTRANPTVQVNGPITYRVRRRVVVPWVPAGMPALPAETVGVDRN